MDADEGIIQRDVKPHGRPGRPLQGWWLNPPPAGGAVGVTQGVCLGRGGGLAGAEAQCEEGGGGGGAKPVQAFWSTLRILMFSRGAVETH